jgi:predicted membrane protein (TIGR00267 family)
MSRSAVAKEYGFAAILGLTDGILTALTLAAGSIIGSRTGLSISLGLRVASASALAGGVVFLTAELARRNHELVHAEQQLNLLSHGRLATTRLGHFVVVESSKATIVVVASNFVGALLPFLVGLISKSAFIPICSALVMLGALGVTIARVTYRSKVLWATSLMIAGALLTALGLWLRII